MRPRLFDTLAKYNKQKLQSDILSGIIVGIVALPLAIAFAIASGVGPEKGIITAIIAGFLISFLGGSHVQIGGPTGAFIIIVVGIIQNYGFSGLLIATIMAGGLLILMGVLRLGAVIKFIPFPIVIGFTAGIALTIFTTQIPDLLGLHFNGVPIPKDFLSKWAFYFQHFSSFTLSNILISLTSILLILLTPKISKKIPGSLIAIILLTLTAYYLNTYTKLPTIETIGHRFNLNIGLPSFTIPSFSWSTLQTLFPVAFTIALLGAIESLLSATVADGAIGKKHDSNMELIAQGIANVVTPFFGGIPATGAIARTMTNINNGGRTPIAGIVHAITLLLILLFLMPLSSYIPMACLAGILAVVSYNMSGWKTFKALLSGNKSDVAVLLITFFLTVLFDLTIAIEIGLLLACLLFMKRVMETTKISVLTDEIHPNQETDLHLINESLNIPQGVEVYEIKGPYFFGIATRFEELMTTLQERPKVRIIRMRRVPFIDSTGLHNLQTLFQMSQKENIAFILSGVNKEVQTTLEKQKLTLLIGKENICENINQAIERAKSFL